MAATSKLPLIQAMWLQCSKSGGFDAIFNKVIHISYYDKLRDKLLKYSTIQVKLISGGEGKCEAEFTVEKEHTNFMGLHTKKI